MSWQAYPSWLNAGDNAWQMTAATFVGLMSLPGLAVLYASQGRWKEAVEAADQDRDRIRRLRRRLFPRRQRQ